MDYTTQCDTTTHRYVEEEVQIPLTSSICLGSKALKTRKRHTRLDSNSFSLQNNRTSTPSNAAAMDTQPPIQLPNAGTTTSAEFSRRFATLPDELKIIAIGHAVSTPKVIDLRQYEQACRAMTSAFDGDKDLSAIDHEQFDRVNRFKMPASLVYSPAHCSAQLAIRIRHLRVYFTLTCTGGAFTRNQRTNDFPFLNQDAATITSILRCFTRLDSLDIVLDNTGSAVAGISYTFFGIPCSRRQLPQCMAMERSQRVANWMGHVQKIALPQWRQALKIRKRLVLVHNFALQRSGRFETELPDHDIATQPITDPADVAEAIATVHKILDAPVAVVHYVKG